MPKKLDIAGQRFGRLVAIDSFHNGRSPKWRCVCDCGKEVFSDAGALRSGNPRSCGCGQRDAARRVCINKTKHGLSKTRLANILHSMRQRCYYEKSINYSVYGGRGITVCDEWKNDSIKFFDWAIENGYKNNLSIDRINPNGNYDPSNCRFVDSKAQANNRTNNVRVLFQGELMTAVQISEKVGIGLSTIVYRINAGWKSEDLGKKPHRQKP